jgi:5-methylcytosine-specific restriction protein A
VARSAPSPCAEHGCPTLVHKGSRCEAHAKRDYSHVQETEYRLKARKFYCSRPWTLLSKAYRRRHPLCQHCTAKGITKVADVSDHIVEISDDWSRRLDATNLQSLCNSCHGTKTNTEKQRRLRS